MNLLKRLVPILGLLVLLGPARLNSQAPEPVVHAIVFFSPTCPHCHELISNTLIPLQEQYGNRLALLGMDTSQPWGNNLYFETLRFFEVPQVDWVVPILIVADEVLIGGNDIPGRLRTIIEEGLAAGGVDLPNYPALVTLLREQDVLDPRYPDRLIVRQDPGPETDEASPAVDSIAAADSIAAVDSTETPDSTETAYSTAAGDSISAVDSVPSETPVPVEDPPISLDTAAVEEAPPVTEVPVAEVPEPDPQPADSSATDTPVAAEEVSAPEVIDPGIPPEVPVEANSAEVGIPDTQEGRGVDSVGAVAQDEPSPESVGSMDLADAVQSMDSMTMWDRFNLDPTGGSISVLVLLGMIVSLVLRGFPPRVRGREWPGWVIPALVVVGVFVASYLSYIEITHAQAACGPVGDCNTVNQSEYATLFGVLPVGVLGLIGYGLILALWFLRRTGPEEGRRVASLGLWGAALFGTLFSVYLTFLEPFVIGATCAWCLSSAVIMTLLLWASAPLAARVWPGSE